MAVPTDTDVVFTRQTSPILCTQGTAYNGNYLYCLVRIRYSRAVISNYEIFVYYLYALMGYCLVCYIYIYMYIRLRIYDIYDVSYFSVQKENLILF